MNKNDIGFSTCFPHENSEVNCVSDEECNDHLFCGYKNCLAPFSNDKDTGLNSLVNESANCCGRNQFKSPNYPNNYFLNDEKNWLITAPVDLIIILNFGSFQVRLTVSRIIETTISIQTFHRLGIPSLEMIL